MAIGRASWILAAALAALACAPAQGDGLAGEATARAWEGNGFRLNGFRLNGFRLNGFRLNSGALDGEGGDLIELIALTLASDEDVAIRWVHEGELRAYSPQTGVHAGTDLLEAKLHFEVTEASTYRHRMLKIVGITPPGSEAPTWRYQFEVKDEAGPWDPLCPDEYGAPLPAVLIEDLWDPATGDRVRPLPSDAVTIACLDAALAKCAEWGYVPWASVAGVPLADYHQACTRAVRADYCGDGTPHTVDGTAIHVLDELGIEAEAPDGGYVIEAEWGPDGAACMNPAHARVAGLTLDCQLPTCAAPFLSGGVIQTGTVVTE